MKIALFGSYGEKNLGDEAICASVVDNILNLYRDAEIIIFSHNEVETKKRFSEFENIQVRPVIASGIRSLIKQVKNREFKESIEILKSCDFVVIGGGGLFYDSEFNVGTNPILVWLIRVIIFRYLKLKIILYAIGIGPINFLLSKVFLRIIGNTVHRITVRDNYSLRLLQQCNVYTPVLVSADPVWTHEWEERSMQDIGKNPILRVDGRRKIGIQIRIVKGVDETEFVQRVTDFVDRMVEKYLLSVVLIPMSLENPNDKLLMEKIQINSSYESKVEIYDTLTYKGIADVMQECELLIVARMHSIIMATQLGIPFIALSYSPKTDDLIRRLDLGDYSWPISHIETTVLERIYLKLMKQRVTTRKYLLEKSKYMKEQANINLNLFKS